MKRYTAITVFTLIFSLIMSLLSFSSTQTEVLAKKKICLNNSKLNIETGKSKTLFVKNSKKKPVWKITSGKKNIKVKKNGNKLKVTGVKRGSAKVSCKVSGKNLVCKIKVTKKNKNTQKENNTNEAVKSPDATISATATASSSGSASGSQNPASTGSGTPAVTNVPSAMPSDKEIVPATNQSSVAPTSIPTGTPTVPPIKYREFKLEPLEKELDEKFVKQVSEMSMKLAKASMDEDLKNNNNVLVSPINVFMALTMVLNGAGGETLDELKSFLCGDMSTEDFNKNMSLFGNNVDESANLVFNTANSVWLKKNSGWKLKEDFVNINKKYFNVECFEEEFNQETVDMLNGWVKEKTNGMIPQIIDEFDPLEVLYLVSTLVFEGEWDSQYLVNSDAKTDEFTNSKNEKEKCILLTRERNTKYIEGDKYTGFAEPYKGGKYDFVALLPNKDSSVSEVLDSLANSDFSGIYKSAGYEQVLSKMPEFKYDYSLSVKNTLKQFGVDDMFDMSRSNLSNMATSDSGVNLYAKDVCHKTHIELDRNGTKAAAVTYINMAPGAASDLPTPPPPKKVICDRPFVYVIVQRSTGIPVFVGAVNSVEDK